MDTNRRTKLQLQSATHTAAPDLHVCPQCDSDLVQPTHWFEQGDRHWHVDLRCPECEWAGRGSFSQDEVDRYDEELDRGCKILMEDLRLLSHSNMEDDVERFAVALGENRILPEDF